jgi:hypothetical protein
LSVASDQLSGICSSSTWTPPAPMFEPREFELAIYLGSHPLDATSGRTLRAVSGWIAPVPPHRYARSDRDLRAISDLARWGCGLSTESAPEATFRPPTLARSLSEPLTAGLRERFPGPSIRGHRCEPRALSNPGVSSPSGRGSPEATLQAGGALMPGDPPHRRPGCRTRERHLKTDADPPPLRDS